MSYVSLFVIGFLPWVFVFGPFMNNSIAVVLN